MKNKNKKLGENSNIASYPKLHSASLGIETSPIEPNGIIDPSAARDLSIDPDFVPGDMNELVVAVTTLLHSVQPESIETVYHKLKKVIVSQIDMARKSVSTIETDSDITNSKEGNKTMKMDKKVEEVLRRSIRQILKEESGNSTSAFDTDEDDIEDAELDADDGFGEPKTGVRKSHARGDKVNYDGIASELDNIDPKDDGGKWSIAGAKQAVDKTVRKTQFLQKMALEEPEKFDELIDDATEGYIDYLASAMKRPGGDGDDLTEDDIELLRTHPDMVQELDGWKEFFMKYVRRAGYDSATDYTTEF